MSRRFVLLDRDGTINEEAGYVLEPDQLRLIPGAASALRKLREVGLGLIVVTNQSPVGRGWLTDERLEEINGRLAGALAEEGAGVDAVYVCPHRPEQGCDCRKPQPGLAVRAAKEHGFELAESFVVGDHAADMGMANAVGATAILVRTGHGDEELANGAGELADHVVADLREASELIQDIVRSGALR